MDIASRFCAPAGYFAAIEAAAWRRCRQGIRRSGRLFRWQTLAAACGILLSAPASAIFPFTDEEWALLPDYCHHQSNVSIHHRATRSPRWEAYFREDFPSIHHWCAVYMWMGRAYKAGPASTSGRFYLGRAEDDLGYFLDRARKDSPILAEVYTKRGEIYLLQKRFDRAEDSFKRAREIDPARPQAYFLWAHYLYSSGKIADARAVAEDGLAHAPESKSLQGLVADIKAGKPTP